MRNLMFILVGTFLIGLAYWAYTENYTTQAAKKRVQELQIDIAREREKIAVLRAEWEYQNRPERLRELADMNFKSLSLVPLAATHFGEIETVAFPAEDLGVYNMPVEAQNVIEGAE